MIKLIRDEQTYNQAFKRIEELWGAEIGTPNGDDFAKLIMKEAERIRHI